MRRIEWSWWLLVAVLAGVAGGRAAAFDTAKWHWRADLELTDPGFHILYVPAEVFDRSQPDLDDLRLLDEQGAEVPYAFSHDTGRPAARVAAVKYEVELAPGRTLIDVTTGTTAPLSQLSLGVAPGDFIKSARVELSSDGVTWETLARGTPIFRRSGVEQLRVELARRTAAKIRLTLSDADSTPVAVTGVWLGPAPFEAEPEPFFPQPVSVRKREEFVGETVVTLDLGHRQMPLVGLEFLVNDPVFDRFVTVDERVMDDGVLGEREITRGLISRGPASQAGRPLLVEFPGKPVPRELVVHIENGDSPPLDLLNVKARMKRVALRFNVTRPGRWALLTGNPEARWPRYDLKRMLAEIEGKPWGGRPGLLYENPDYTAPADPLASVPLRGATFVGNGWTHRREVRLARAGVQELELDQAVLAEARADFADLRVVGMDGRQIPYLLEPTRLVREISLGAVAEPDRAGARISRWRIELPRPGLPLRRLVVSSPTELFQRSFVLREAARSEAGDTSGRELGRIDVTRRPGEPERDVVFVFDGRVKAEALELETDNGDNAPIELSGVRAELGVTRVLFPVETETEAPVLYYGNPTAEAPRYDLALVAPRVIAAEKQQAVLAAETENEATKTAWLAGRGTRIIFWGALAVVVAALLGVTAKLLPKGAK